MKYLGEETRTLLMVLGVMYIVWSGIAVATNIPHTTIYFAFLGYIVGTAALNYYVKNEEE